MLRRVVGKGPTAILECENIFHKPCCLVISKTIFNLCGYLQRRNDGTRMRNATECVPSLICQPVLLRDRFCAKNSWGILSDGAFHKQTLTEVDVIPLSVVGEHNTNSSTRFLALLQYPPSWPTTSPPSSALSKTRSTALSTTKSAPAAMATVARENTSSPPTRKPSYSPTYTRIPPTIPRTR